MPKFLPKGKDVLKQEVIDSYGLDPEAQGETIDQIVEDRYKDEEFKAAEKNKTAKAREALENMTKAKEFYKNSGKPKGDNQPNGEYVTKDDLKDFGQRQRYSHLNDEEYASINALAKASGKSFEETLEKNPVATAYMKTIDIDKRLAGATKAPGTRFMPGEQKTEEDKASDELSDDLPVGFKSQSK